MRVLVACEESQRVCIAFRNNGHEAYSCDIIECSGGHPEWHIMQDVLPLLNGNCKFKTLDGKVHTITGEWDLIIAHPPCTYLSNAGAVRMRINGVINQDRYEKAMKARDFFIKILNANCKMIIVENPVPMKIVNLPKYDQIIQPWQFGHKYSKKTCLWLKNVAHLEPTEIITEGITPYVNGGHKDAHGNYRRFRGRNERDQKNRSKTFTGIAEAFANQYGGINKDAGVWIDWPSCEYVCSICGRSSETVKALHTCPNCGSIMRTNEVYPNLDLYIEENGMPDWYCA